MDTLQLVAALWLVCGVASFLIALGRAVSNAVTWLLIGALLGPLGALIALFRAHPSKAQKRDLAMATLYALEDRRARGDLSDEDYETQRQAILAKLAR